MHVESGDAIDRNIKPEQKMISKQQLRDQQQPVRNSYTENPETALQVLTAEGTVDFEHTAINVESFLGKIPAGLHKSTGGDGSYACSVDMLLQSLVGCAGVTLAAVATSMELEIESAKIEAHGTLDFRGTLGMDKQVPVGLTKVELRFDIAGNATPEQISKLVELTERYCVIYQTFKNSPELVSTLAS